MPGGTAGPFFAAADETDEDGTDAVDVATAAPCGFVDVDGRFDPVCC